MATEKNEEVRLVPADSSHGINSNEKKQNMINIRIPILPHDYRLERKYKAVCKKKKHR